jgi:hypothetical protein
MNIEHTLKSMNILILTHYYVYGPVVEECVKLAESNPRVAGIIIPERSVGNNYWARVRDFERSFYTGTPIESPRFFRKDVALKAGGFDENVVFYEEATLPYKIERMGYNVRARIRSPILHHEEDFKLAKWLIKRYYYAKTLKIYSKKYRDYATIQANPSWRLTLFLKNRRFYVNPALALGVIALKTLEYIATVMGYLASTKAG